MKERLKKRKKSPTIRTGIIGRKFGAQVATTRFARKARAVGPSRVATNAE